MPPPRRLAKKESTSNMPESLRLIPATSPEWSEWLAGVPHDFFHTAGHHRVWEENGSGSAWMAVYGSRGRSVAWPYLLRPIELDASAGTGLFDITSVDGYAGPLLDGCVAGECFTSAAIDAIFHQWQELGVVSAFARFHPLLENHRAVPDTGVRLTDGETRSIHFQGHTVSIDLQLEAAKAQSLYRESHLRQIRRSRRAGLAIAPDDSPRGFADFVRLYHQTMRRNHADQHYFFSERFLKGLRDTPRRTCLHPPRPHRRPYGGRRVHHRARWHRAVPARRRGREYAIPVAAQSAA